MRLQRPEPADVGRTLGDHDVPGVHEAGGDQLERLLAPDGDDQVVGVGRDALVAHDLDQLLAQLRAALADPVLQGRGALLAQQPGDHVLDRVEVQGRGVGLAPGERDDLGAGRDGEQRADGGCGQPTDPVA